MWQCVTENIEQSRMRHVKTAFMVRQDRAGQGSGQCRVEGRVKKIADGMEG